MEALFRCSRRFELYAGGDGDAGGARRGKDQIGSGGTRSAELW